MALTKDPFMGKSKGVVPKPAGGVPAGFEEINGVLYPVDPVSKNLAQRELGERDPMRRVLTNIANTAAPQVQAAALDPTIRQQQMALITQLQAQAAGQGPSLAQQQFQQAGNTALQKTMGAVRAGVGANPALAARTAALAGTNLLGNLAAESGMARLKEQQDAQAALAQQLGARQALDLQSRQQDIALSQAQADTALKAQGAQMQAALGNIGSTSSLFDRIHAGKPASSGGGFNWNSLIPVAAGTIATMATGGNPVAGAAAAGATSAAMPSAGAESNPPMRLVGGTQPDSQKSPTQVKSSPFLPIKSKRNKEPVYGRR